MRVMIIDDEPLAVQLLEQYTNRHPDLRLVGAYTNPVDGLEIIQQDPPDVLLLDIQMPELNGLHLARLVRGRCAVILTTAYEEHALAGYALDIVDYLVKPVSYDRFCRAIEKVTPPKPSPGAPATTEVFAKSGHRIIRVDTNTLRYGSADGDYLHLHFDDGGRVVVNDNLGDLLARLPGDEFCRIHRSHFVCMRKIDFVERRRVVIGGHWLPVSDSYRTAFRKRLGSL